MDFIKIFLLFKIKNKNHITTMQWFVKRCMQNPNTTIPKAIIYDLIIDIMMTGFNQYQMFCINVGWNIKSNCSIVFNYKCFLFIKFSKWLFVQHYSIALYANNWLSVLILFDPIYKRYRYVRKKMMDTDSINTVLIYRLQSFTFSYGQRKFSPAKLLIFLFVVV